MEEGSGTSSSLLWEVKRLLDETENLPQVLVMENVSQVHSKTNMPHFQKWLDYLDSRGYSSYWQDLNSKDFGVAQSRKRCICVSILGQYTYEFPKSIQLTAVINDYFEDEVEEVYFLKNDTAKSLIDKLIVDGRILENRGWCKGIELSIDPKILTISRAIMARQDRGISRISGQGSGVVKCEKL